MSEPNAPPGFPWFRWSLIVLLIVVGVVLVFVFGPESLPVVQPDPTIR